MQEKSFFQITSTAQRQKNVQQPLGSTLPSLDSFYPYFPSPQYLQLPANNRKPEKDKSSPKLSGTVVECLFPSFCCVKQEVLTMPLIRSPYPTKTMDASTLLPHNLPESATAAAEEKSHLGGSESHRPVGNGQFRSLSPRSGSASSSTPHSICH